MKTTLPLLSALVLLPLTAQADCSSTRFTGVGSPGFDDDVDSAVGVRSADFNHDGKPDLVAATFYGVSLFLHGDAASAYFGRPIKISETGTRFFEVGDVNGDGNPDIVLTHYDVNLVTTLLGNGDGTFTTKTLSTTSPWRVALADMNGDGKLDLLLTTDSPKSLAVYPGRGDGTWGPPSSVAIPTLGTTIATGDLDGDGRLDVVTGYSDPSRIDLWHGNGNGTLSPLSSTDVAEYPLSMTPSDVDGDGRLDLVYANAKALTISVLHNRGNASFDAPVTYALPPAPRDTVPGLNQSPRAILVGNFTGRGRKDIAVTSVQWITIFPANGDGSYGTPTTFSAGNYALTDMVALDFTGDGRLDFAASNFNFGGGVGLLAFQCGLSDPVLRLKYPTVSTNQPVTLTANVFGNYPKGTLTVRDGSTILATRTLTTGQELEELSFSLAAGDHSLVAEYSGDLWNEPASSTPTVVHVTTATTTTTATATPNPVAFGTPFLVKPTVTSSTGDTPGGQYLVTADGKTDTGFGTLSPAGLPTPTQVILAAGTHVLQVSYLGDATHPPSSPAPMTIVVNKATPVVTVRDTDPFAPKAGQGFAVTVWVTAPSYAATPAGTIEIRVGGKLVGTSGLYGTGSGSGAFGWAKIPVGWLNAGSQSLTINYWGDTNYAPATATAQINVASGGTPPAPKRRASPHR